MTRDEMLRLVKPIWAEELRQRQQRHINMLRRVAEAMAARGIGRSGVHVSEALNAAIAEARGRAADARQILVRAIAQTQSRWTARELHSLYLDIITDMNRDIDRELESVLYAIPLRGEQFNSQVLALAHEEVAAINKEIAELALFAATPDVAEPANPSVVFQGPVYGSVQTGGRSVANVSITFDTASAGALLEAVKALRAALKASPPEDLPSYADAVFTELETEAAKPDPQSNRIATLLGTGASIIGGLANAPDAWHTVRVAAAALGVGLP
jgi:hypothetical protein